MVINGQIIAVAETGNVWHLLSTIEKHIAHMNLVNITTALHRLAKMLSGDQVLHGHPVIGVMLIAVRKELASMNANDNIPSSQSLSNIMWSLATLSIADWPLLQEVATLTVTHMDRFKPLELSTLLWAFAKLHSQYDLSGHQDVLRVFEAAALHVKDHASTFNFRNLVTTVGAFATLGKATPVTRVFQIVAQQMVKVSHTANCQELAKAAWAFGTAKVASDALFGIIAQSAIPRIHHFQPQELSNLLWGFAANDFFHLELIESAAIVVERSTLNTQQLANILWAMTRLRPQLKVARSTVVALMPRCCELLAGFQPQEFASTVMAAAKAFGRVGEELGQLDHALPPQVEFFFSAGCSFVTHSLHEFSHQSLANVATAYTAVQATSVLSILTQVGQVILKRVKGLSRSVLLQLIRTFTADFSDFHNWTHFEKLRKAVTQALFKEAGRGVSGFQPEEQRSLARLCDRAMNVRSGKGSAVEELQHCCNLLAAGTCSQGEQYVSIRLEDALVMNNKVDTDVPVPTFVSECEADALVAITVEAKAAKPKKTKAPKAPMTSEMFRNLAAAHGDCPESGYYQYASLSECHIYPKQNTSIATERNDSIVGDEQLFDLLPKSLIPEVIGAADSLPADKVVQALHTPVMGPAFTPVIGPAKADLVPDLAELQEDVPQKVSPSSWLQDCSSEGMGKHLFPPGLVRP